jgi:hypothetical protein
VLIYHHKGHLEDVHKQINISQRETHKCTVERKCFLKFSTIMFLQPFLLPPLQLFITYLFCLQCHTSFDKQTFFETSIFLLLTVVGGKIYPILMLIPSQFQDFCHIFQI